MLLGCFGIPPSQRCNRGGTLKVVPVEIPDPKDVKILVVTIASWEGEKHPSNAKAQSLLLWERVNLL